MEFDEVVRSRRSVRTFARRDVSEEVVRDVLGCALQAPSSMNGQPWAFVVVRSPDTKRRFSEIKTSGMRRILEKTGLIALAGVLKAIDGGMVEAGSRVLCCLTSGVSSAGGRAQPEVTVRDEKDVVEYSEHVLSEELRVHGASGGILFQDSRVRGPT